VQVGGATKADLLVRLERHSVSFNEHAEILFAAPEFAMSDEVSDLRIAFICPEP
jgi:hypothetical protein